MPTAFIGLGSNLGPGQGNLLAAWRRLQEHPKIRGVRLSSPYETAPVEMASANWFTNAVGEIETDLTPEELLETMLAIERDMGRDRRQGRDRIIDLDLLFYGELIRESPQCRVPHPEIPYRLFVLAPLAEIAPGLRHPHTGLTPAAMVARLDAAGQGIRKVDWERETDR
ncbi:MAG: 2-amino-4-hydroxy-6-hydroxymethyldihydropteridine diphosphokinase [Desulfobacteraceae bacterium]|nr:2-amino-4-hydroxy-6-hydroxymethyldihydropteridine diphosphokinase [Desulfobacteraceae bacterium]